MLAVTLGFVLIIAVFVFGQEDVKVSPVVGLVIVIASICIMATIIATRLWLLSR